MTQGFPDIRGREQMLALTPRQFERFVAYLFESRGYSVSSTPASGDEGIDLRLRKGTETAIVQCKRVKGAVGQPVVRDLYGTLVHTGVDEAYLVTTGTFSAPAKNFARGKPIHLVDGRQLERWVPTPRPVRRKATPSTRPSTTPSTRPSAARPATGSAIPSIILPARDSSPKKRNWGGCALLFIVATGAIIGIIVADKDTAEPTPTPTNTATPTATATATITLTPSPTWAATPLPHALLTYEEIVANYEDMTWGEFGEYARSITNHRVHWKAKIEAFESDYISLDVGQDGLQYVWLYEVPEYIRSRLREGQAIEFDARIYDIWRFMGPNIRLDKPVIFFPQIAKPTVTPSPTREPPTPKPTYPTFPPTRTAYPSRTPTATPTERASPTPALQ